MTRDEVRAKLAELPDTADGIAAYLAEGGVKGQVGMPSSCPLANYLSPDVHVGSNVVTTPRQGMGSRIRESSDLPMAVQQFVYNFDDGKYPELIA